MKNKELEKFLNDHDIKYGFFEHEPLLTMEDSYKYTNHIPGEHCKNLFVTDKKRVNYYHILTKGQKVVDLKQLQTAMNATRLSFPSAECLDGVLHLEPGCVNPLTMIYTDDHVHYYFDEELLTCDYLIFCPSVVDESINMTVSEFKKFIEATGKTVNFIKM